MTTLNNNKSFYASSFALLILLMFGMQMFVGVLFLAFKTFNMTFFITELLLFSIELIGLLVLIQTFIWFVQGYSYKEILNEYKIFIYSNKFIITICSIIAFMCYFASIAFVMFCF
jgi:hypothetical protein